jgi:hypothetical protein
MSGICCVCEEKQSIIYSPLPRQEEKDRGLDNFEINMTYGENINFIVEPHDFYGQPCSGSGQIPQFILRES